MDCVHIGTAETFVALAPVGAVSTVWPVHVSIAAGPFRGSFTADIDMRAFRNALDRVYQTLEGTASLHGAEGTLDLELTGDGRGRFTLTARARPIPHRAELSLTADIDQSHLTAVLSSIDRVFLSSPVELE